MKMLKFRVNKIAHFILYVLCYVSQSVHLQLQLVLSLLLYYLYITFVYCVFASVRSLILLSYCIC